MTHRSPSGRVLEIEVVTNSRRPFRIRQEYPIRNALNLRSTFFTFSRSYDENRELKWLTVKGAGWGHGVGLCQVGATMMAKHGYDFSTILRKYYHGIGLYKIYQ